MGGRNDGAVVSAAAAQQEGPGFESPSWQGLSVWSLHVLLVSAWVLSGYSGFLPQSKDMQHHRLIGDSKLPVGVMRVMNVRVSGCSFLCVGPAINWRLVQGVPRLSPEVSWDRLQLHRDPHGYAVTENGWKDFCSDNNKYI